MSLFQYCIVIVLLVVITKQSDGVCLSAWDSYVNKYSKSFENSIEEQESRSIWVQNLELIKIQNAKADAGESTYWLAENKFTDTNLSELQVNLGFVPRASVKRSKKGIAVPTFSITFYTMPLNAPLPSSYDARNVMINGRSVSLVSPVQDQGLCGCCYVFSAIDSITSIYMKKYNQMLNISIQEVVDCSSPWGNFGCNGGSMENVFRYAWNQNGLTAESTYPYTAAINQTCKASRKIGSRYAATRGLIRVQANEQYFKSALVNQGPISIGINANVTSFILYSNGVYSDIGCNSNNLNHAVLLVGYGSDVINGINLPYWLIKNSWGTGWGIRGYMKILRGSRNLCGVLSTGTLPVLV